MITDGPQQHEKLTPMLSVMIGVVTALIIVAIVVMVVLRIQHSAVENDGKSHTEVYGKANKAVTIQHELMLRDGNSLLTDVKHNGSPFRKLDSTGEFLDSDEKNPDIIPQQISGNRLITSQQLFTSYT